MSIISDIQNTFSDIAGAQDYVLLNYVDQTPVINIYGVLEQSVQQRNDVAIKPLEQSNFTSDSVQIKPVVITIRGVIYPSHLSLISSYRGLTDFIAAELLKWQNYINGTNLFILFNTFSFGDYFPLKFLGISHIANQDMTIPEVTLMFMQVQTTTATSYSTTDTSGSNVDQPMNKPQISK